MLGGRVEEPANSVGIEGPGASGYAAPQFMLSQLADEFGAAVFGYFDLDATFSVAFTLIMTNATQTDSTSLRHAEVQKAISILQYMASHGNEAAEIRRKDIQQMCTAVWPSHVGGDGSLVGENTDSPHYRTWSDSAVPADGSTSRNGPTGEHLLPMLRNETSNLAHGSAPRRQTYTDNLQYQNSPMHYSTVLAWADGLNTLIPEDLEGLENAEGGGILSMYNDPMLPLTGIDTSDWEEMENILLR